MFGYCTSSAHETLRAHTTRVARNSLHIQAEAIDLRMPGIETLRVALALHRSKWVTILTLTSSTSTSAAFVSGVSSAPPARRRLMAINSDTDNPSR